MSEVDNNRSGSRTGDRSSVPAHTPGPWQWWTSNSWKRLKRNQRGVTQNVLEPYVCRDGHPDLSINDADMKLIEAAPDLLMALCWLHGLLEAGGGRPSDIDDQMLLAMGAARAALTKATGK